MATLAYTSAIQTRIAYILRGAAYSTLTADEKAIIDGTWASGTPGGMALDALTHIQQVGQWFSLTAPASVPAEWEAWLVWRTVMLCGQQMAPDRWQQYVEAHDDAEMGAIDAYARTAITADPGATPEATVLTIQNVRYYVTSYLVRRDQGWETVDGSRRRRPRKWVPFELVDSAFDRVIRNIWSRADWKFRRRQCTLTITPYSVSGATYTDSTKTITKASGFATTIPAGAVCTVTDGTGATLGDYIVASATANTVVLTSSIGAAADAQTDIAATVVGVTNNLVGETFDQGATRRFYFDDAQSSGTMTMLWADGDEMSSLRASSFSNETTGRPTRFRFEENTGTVAWYFYPTPDDTYRARGEVLVTGPTLTTLSATTTAVTRFPRVFDQIIKDSVLAEVLFRLGDKYGMVLKSNADDEITRLLPQYANVGKQEDDQSIRDVYGDYRYVNNTGWGGLRGGL